MAEQALKEDGKQDLAVVKAQARFVVGSGTGVIPQNFEGLWRLASIMAASKMMPKGIETPEAVFVAVQMGLEVGLSPMQAVQNIAVINGRPSIWGDVGIALVQASGLLEDFKETVSGDGDKLTATCWAKRVNRNTPVERSFSMLDAKTAGLLGKSGPWSQYPKRMLQMRARWWVLKDLFSDVLKGLKSAEETIDLVPEASGAFSLPEPARQDAPTPDFDSQIPEDLRSDVPRFLAWAAAAQGQPVEAIRASALRNMDGFVGSVRRWAQANPHQAEKEETAQQAPTADDIIAKFWNLKSTGWSEFYAALTQEEFDGWPPKAQKFFLAKAETMTTKAKIPSPWPRPAPPSQDAPEETPPQPPVNGANLDAERQRILEDAQAMMGINKAFYQQAVEECAGGDFVVANWSREVASAVTKRFGELLDERDQVPKG
jgi:hypothetical protein